MTKFKIYNLFNHAYFVTSAIEDFKWIFISRPYFSIIIDTLTFMRRQKKLKLLAYVIMPNHVHLVIWPQNNHMLSEIMRDFKKYTSRKIIEQLKNDNKSSLIKLFREKAKNIKGQSYKVWKSGSWSENIYSRKFLLQKINYIHKNPLKWGLAKDLKNYLYSSYQNYYLNNNSVMEIDRIDW